MQCLQEWSCLLFITCVKNTRAHTGTSCLVNCWSPPSLLIQEVGFWDRVGGLTGLAWHKEPLSKVLLLFEVFFLYKLRREVRLWICGGGGFRKHIPGKQTRVELSPDTPGSRNMDWFSNKMDEKVSTECLCKPARRPTICLRPWEAENRRL